MNELPFPNKKYYYFIYVGHDIFEQRMRVQPYGSIRERVTCGQ